MVFAALLALMASAGPAGDAGLAPASSAPSDAGKVAPPAPSTGSSQLPPLPTGDAIPWARSISKLPNGLTVVLTPFASGGVTAYATLVRAGSRNEVDNGKTGYAYVMAHLMSLGTKKNPAEIYNGTLRQLGIDSNSDTTEDYTLFYAEGPSAALPQLIDLEADRFQHLDYSPAAFATAAKAVLSDYLKEASNPEQRLDEVLHKTAFAVHPYRHTPVGLVDDIRAMPKGYEYSKSFFRKFYTPDNTTLFVSGDFKPDQVLPLIQQAYGSWKGKAAEPRIKAEPTQSSERTAQVDWPTQTFPRWAVSYHTPQSVPTTKDGAVQQLLGPLLTGPTSTLFRSLVLDKQTIDHMDVWYSSHRDPGLFTVVISAKDPKDLPDIQKAWDDAVAAVAAGIDPAALQAVQLNQIYGLAGQLETAGALNLALAAEAGPTGDPDGLSKKYQQLAAVTPQDLSDFAKLYLLPGGRVQVVLTTATGGGK